MCVVIQEFYVNTQLPSCYTTKKLTELTTKEHLQLCVMVRLSSWTLGAACGSL